jgi:hypothetical protein
VLKINPQKIISDAAENIADTNITHVDDRSAGLFAHLNFRFQLVQNTHLLYRKL